MSNIEFIVEVYSSLSKIFLYFLVESQSCFNYCWHLLANRSFEFAEMLVQKRTIDTEKRTWFWEWDSQEPEMSL